MQKVEDDLPSHVAQLAALRRLVSCSQAVDDRFLVLKGVREEDKGDMQVWGQCSYSLAPGGGKEQVEVSGRYVRCWQGKGRSDWNVVVEVAPSQREAFFRAAAFLRQQVGVVVGPCLTALGCALRKERQTVFNSLLQQGLKPRWRKGVEIEFFSAGGWIQHDFEYFGG